MSFIVNIIELKKDVGTSKVSVLFIVLGQAHCEGKKVFVLADV